MKKFLKVLGIIVGAIVLIIILAMIFTSGLPKVANSMFSDIKAGNIEAAYSQTSEGFKTSTTLDQFKTFLQESNLTTIKNTTRSERSIENNQGKLIGSAYTTDGGTVHLEINLIKESGKWKIYNILLPQSGVTDQTTTNAITATGEIPSQAEAVAMIQKAMGKFADAINKKDFTAFYNNISEIWKGQTTVAELQKAFQVFIDNKIDMAFTKTATPTIPTQPTIDKDGILDVQGSFAVQSGAVVFEQKFYKENNEWKLFGINVQIK